MMQYKNGVYEGDYGIRYFVHDGRVLLTHLGNTYKASPLFLFGNWREELLPEMVDQFSEVYNKSKQW